MRQKIWGAKLGAIVLSLLFTAGCPAMLLMSLGGAAAIGSYKWMEGTMEKDYPRPLQEVWTAALAACKDMKLDIKVQQLGATEGHIDAVAPPDTNVNIQLLPRPNQITTVKVRFGLMGNQDASAYFNRRIMVHLGIATN